MIICIRFLYSHSRLSNNDIFEALYNLYYEKPNEFRYIEKI